MAECRTSDPSAPPDLAATIFHKLGIAPNAEFMDSVQRPRPGTDGGTVIRELA